MKEEMQLNHKSEYIQRMRLRQKDFPELQPLITKLESLIPGTIVIPQFEDDLDLLLKNGKLIVVPVRILEMRTSKCHENAADLHIAYPKRLKIQTGWAFTKNDGLWRQHSWVFDRKKKQIIETSTIIRSKYWGVTLKGKSLKEFLFWQDSAPLPAHIKVQI